MRAAAIVRSGKSCAFRPFLRRPACAGLTMRVPDQSPGPGPGAAATWPLHRAGRAQYPGAMRETLPPETLPADIRTAKVRTAKVRTAKAKFAEVVLVCRKCAKRQGLTKGQARALAKAAYKAAHPGAEGKKRSKPRIVESGCLGPCPKRMLAVATGASVAAGRVLLLDPRDATAAFPELGPDFGPNAKLGARPGDASATDRGAPA